MIERQTARPARQSLGDIFGTPIVIGVLSTVGLISALVGDDVWDWVSWFALGAPIAVAAFCIWRGQK